ncbi:unnamed protein product [Schistosoma turkestanicum]|nr:unnamed protein product [Schistosoma turkestanicum]
MYLKNGCPCSPKGTTGRVVTIDECHKTEQSSEKSTQVSFENASGSHKSENNTVEKLLNVDAQINDCDSPDANDSNIPAKEDKGLQSKVDKLVGKILNVDDEEDSNYLS